jgi:hypothetical protein
MGIEIWRVTILDELVLPGLLNLLPVRHQPERAARAQLHVRDLHTVVDAAHPRSVLGQRDPRGAAAGAASRRTSKSIHGCSQAAHEVRSSAGHRAGNTVFMYSIP